MRSWQIKLRRVYWRKFQRNQLEKSSTMFPISQSLEKKSNQLVWGQYMTVQPLQVDKCHLWMTVLKQDHHYNRRTFDILLRSRMRKYCITSDVKKAFLQTKLDPVDRGAQRLFWYNNLGERKIIAYRFIRVIFGSAPVHVSWEQPSRSTLTTTKKHFQKLWRTWRIIHMWMMFNLVVILKKNWSGSRKKPRKS